MRYRVSHQPYLHHPYLIYDDDEGVVMLYSNNEDRAKRACLALNMMNDWEVVIPSPEYERVMRNDLKG